MVWIGRVGGILGRRRGIIGVDSDDSDVDLDL